MMRLFIFILSILFLHNTDAQSLNEFKYFKWEAYSKLYLGVAASYAFVANPEAPNPELHKIQGWTGKVEMNHLKLKKGEKKYKMQYKLLADVFLVLENQVNGNGQKYYRAVESGITNGILGWHSWGWNLNNAKRTSIALGVNLNDYFYFRTYVEDSTLGSNNINNWISPEPQGYYFAAGPALFADVYINRFVIFQSLVTYSFSYWKAVGLEYGIDDPSYPKPHFGSLNLELVSKWGFYFSYDYNFAINRGSNPEKTRRTDLNIGFRFAL